MTTPRDLRAEDLLEHAAWIRRLARRLVGEEAEDLVQDTWLAALRRPPASNRPLGPWLGAVVRNLALNRRRGHARRIARETAAGAEERPLPTPEELLERGEEQRAVVDAVLGLDEPVRGTLLLRYFEGLEPREIAARQGIPGATVRARLKRGVDRVRERLDAQSDGDRARWMRALAPLAGLDRGGAEVALASTTTAATLTMATTLKLAAATFVAAGTLGWFLRGDTPDSYALLAPREASSTARPEGEFESASATPSDAMRVAVAGPAPVAIATGTSSLATGVLLVLDVLTGEAVPDWPLGVAVETEPPDPVIASEASPVGARFATDASGRVTLARDVAAVHDLDAWQAECTLAERWDRGLPSLGEPLPIDWDEAPVALRVPVGPTFPLLLDRPAEVRPEALFAVLTDGDVPGAWGDASTTIRSIGERLAARFAPDPVAARGRVSLLVASDDGRWLGRGVVYGLVGVQPPSRSGWRNARRST